MRLIVVISGILVLLAGAIWALQGIGVIPGSFMSNNPTWIWIGTVTAVVGLGIVVLGLRTGPATRKA